MGLTGFSLCDPKALSSVLRYNTIVRGIIIPRLAGKKELGGFSTSECSEACRCGGLSSFV